MSIVDVAVSATSGCLLKTTGDPLTKEDHISFNDVVLPLAGAGYEQRSHKGKTIRAWGVPSGDGRWWALAEILEMQ